MNCKCSWWPRVRSIIRFYPQMVRDAEANGIPPQKASEAVREAIDITKRKPDGMEHLQLIRRLYWGERETISAAAAALYISRATAGRWHREFVYLVAQCYGLYETE